MCKKILSLLIVITLTLSTSYSALATPQDESMNQNKAKYQELSGKIGELNSQIAGLNGQIEKLNSKLKKNEEDIGLTVERIDQTKGQIDQTQGEIKESEEVLGKRLRAVYKGDVSTSYIALLLTSEDISEFLSRMNAINKIVSLDKQVIEELDKKKESLNNNVKELNNEQNQLEQLKKSTEDSLAEVNTKKDEQQKYLDELNTQKQEVASIIEKNEEELISHSVSTINSSSDIKNIQSAVSTLKELLPQLDTPSVINKTKGAINSGNNKVEQLKAASVPSVSTGVNEPNRGSGSFKKTYTMEATAYANHSITAMGLKPVRNPGGISTIAVDPRVIPLGSKVYIPGYGYAIASDTGGAIKGNIIDLYLNSEAECIAWGRRNVTLHVVAYPGEW